MKIGIILLVIILLGLSFWGIGYIPRYPIWVDDFSCLGDDVLSRIIISGRYYRPDPSLARGAGFSMLDSVKIRRLSDSVFVGRDKKFVFDTFDAYGCGCDVVTDDDGSERLKCKFRRQWKLKNIGKNWSGDDGGELWKNPIVLVVYDLSIGRNGLVRRVSNMRVIDAMPRAIHKRKVSIIK